MLLSASIVASRLLGFIRDAVIAATLGASRETDAYFAAFFLPDLINYFLAGGTVSAVFIPLFSKRLVADDEPGGWRLLSNVATVLGVVMVVAIAIAYVAAPAAVAAMYPGFDEAQVALTTRLTRIVLPGPLFFVVGTLLNGTEQARERFLAAALAPLVYNLGIIVGGLALSPTIGAAGFSWGALAGMVLGPFFVPLLFSRDVLDYRPTVDLGDPGLRRYFWLSLPMMIGASILFFDEWLGRRYASWLEEGAITWLNNARRLMMVPIALVGQAIGQAALPFLSRLRAEGRDDEFHDTFRESVRATATLAVVASAALAIAAHPITTIVYARGAYTDADAAQTALLLAIQAGAVAAWAVHAVVLRGFYARESMWAPTVLSTAIFLAAVPLYAWLARRGGVVGLSWATVIAVSTATVGQVVLFHARFGRGPGRAFVRGLLDGLLAAVPAGAVCIGLLAFLGGSPVAATRWPALPAFLALGVIFGVVSLPILLNLPGPASTAVRNRLARVRKRS